MSHIHIYIYIYIYIYTHTHTTYAGGYIGISMHTYTKILFVAYVIFKLNFSSRVLRFSGLHTQGCSDLANALHSPQGYVIQSRFRAYHLTGLSPPQGSGGGCSQSDLPITLIGACWTWSNRTESPTFILVATLEVEILSVSWRQELKKHTPNFT